MTTITTEVQRLWEHNKQFFGIPASLPRKVIVSKAGGMVKARYEGRRAFVFGYDERHAISRLKIWD